MGSEDFSINSNGTLANYRWMQVCRYVGYAEYKPVSVDWHGHHRLIYKYAMQIFSRNSKLFVNCLGTQMCRYMHHTENKTLCGNWNWRERKKTMFRPWTCLICCTTLLWPFDIAIKSQILNETSIYWNINLNNQSKHWLIETLPDDTRATDHY